MRRRPLIAALTACSVLTLPALADASTKQPKPQKAQQPIVEEFQAKAYPGLVACSKETGVYITATHRSFRAPAKGRLTIVLDQFVGPIGTGDWDLYLYDSAKNLVAYDFTNAPDCYISYRVDKAQTFDIAMCNFDEAGTSAHGKVTFTYA